MVRTKQTTRKSCGVSRKRGAAEEKKRKEERAKARAEKKGTGEKYYHDLNLIHKVLNERLILLLNFNFIYLLTRTYPEGGGGGGTACSGRLEARARTTH